MERERDCWAEWLAERRFGGDEEMRRRGFEELAWCRDRVLDNAQLAGGEIVLDVGCGEGLIGFGALERGADTVVFTDISQDLLDFCREAAGNLGALDRCRFLQAPADDLAALGSNSVDILTTRSVLIYVVDKKSAFNEFARVLRSGGRISLYEPINRFAKREADTWFGYDMSAIPDISRKLRAVYEALQPPDTDPMLSFDERDLIDLAEQAGFFPIHLRFEAEITPVEPRTWSGFLNHAGNPRIPTIAETIQQALSAGEQTQLAAHLRPSSRKAEARGGWQAPTSTRPNPEALRGTQPRWASRPAKPAYGRTPQPTAEPGVHCLAAAR